MAKKKNRAKRECKLILALVLPDMEYGAKNPRRT